MKKNILTILMMPCMMFAVPMVSSARTGAEEMIDMEVQKISLTYSGGVYAYHRSQQPDRYHLQSGWCRREVFQG